MAVSLLCDWGCEGMVFETRSHTHLVRHAVGMLGEGMGGSLREWARRGDNRRFEDMDAERKRDRERGGVGGEGGREGEEGKEGPREKTRGHHTRSPARESLLV